MRVSFCGEGPGDEGLAGVLERLFLELGAPRIEVVVLHPPGRSVTEKARWLSRDAAGFDAWFVHRDADAASADRRLGEFTPSRTGLDPSASERLVPVVVVQETEAWLLLDETAIRAVVGNLRGRAHLGLPRPEQIEGLARPKEVLAHALDVAAERSGRRRLSPAERARYQRQLFDHVDVGAGGPLWRVPAFRALAHRVEAIVRRLTAPPPPG